MRAFTFAGVFSIIILLTAFAPTQVAFAADFNFGCPPMGEFRLAPSESYRHWKADDPSIDRVLTTFPDDKEKMMAAQQVFLVLQREYKDGNIAPPRRLELALLMEQSLARMLPAVERWNEADKGTEKCNLLSFFPYAMSFLAVMAPETFADWPKRVQDDSQLSAMDKDFVFYQFTWFLAGFSKDHAPAARALYDAMLRLFNIKALVKYVGSPTVIDMMSIRMEILKIKNAREAWEYLANNRFSMEEFAKNSAKIYYVPSLGAQNIPCHLEGRMDLDVLFTLEKEAKVKKDWKKQYFYLLGMAYSLASSMDPRSGTFPKEANAIAAKVDALIGDLYADHSIELNKLFVNKNNDLLSAARKNLPLADDSKR